MPTKSFRAYLALNVVTGDMRLTKTVPGARQNQVVVILEIKANLPAPVVPTLMVSVDVPQPVVEAVSGNQAKVEVTPPPVPEGGLLVTDGDTWAKAGPLPTDKST